MIISQQKPLYVLEKSIDGTGFVLNEVKRVSGYKVSNDGKTYVPAVRYERHWYPLYDPKKLKTFINVKRRRDRRNVFYVDGVRHFKADFKMLPFIKEWDLPLCKYRTFGPGGI
ncbi:MAG TPA: hypothetical protein DHR80_22475 [Thalassospira lucentensis]|uniref:Uncharacterized protein n=1 Tax=Thalassospira lucentensis TaxID=168935 RepID=A0A3D5NFU3_9PROT|nr:hypothetical protein [Thalassospira lucentensis]